jgi:hypothetical protein
MSKLDTQLQCASYQEWLLPDNTSQHDFVPRKVYCVSNVTFHAESKHSIKIFQPPTVFVQWHLLLLIFLNFSYFSDFFLHEQIF